MAGSTPEITRVLALPYGTTDLTALHLLDIGRTLMDIVGGTYLAGHSSPAHQLDYLPPLGPGPEYRVTDIVRDFTAWTGRRESLRPESRERLVAYVQSSGWLAYQLERRYEALTPRAAS